MIIFFNDSGIGNFYFPKSKNFPKKNRPKYIYFFHSLVSPNENYVEKSFSGFDYILSPNKLITDQLKYLVKDKSTQIFTVGYQYLRKMTTLIILKQEIFCWLHHGVKIIYSQTVIKNNS